MPTRSSGSVRVFYPQHDRDGVIRALREHLEALVARLPVSRVVLFGSYARDRYTVASDLDVLIVYRGEPRDDAYAISKRTLRIPRLEPHLYTEAECAAASRVVDRMVEGGNCGLRLARSRELR